MSVVIWNESSELDRSMWLVHTIWKFCSSRKVSTNNIFLVARSVECQTFIIPSCAWIVQQGYGRNLDGFGLSHVHHLNHFVTCSRHVPLGLLIPLMWMNERRQAADSGRPVDRPTPAGRPAGGQAGLGLAWPSRTWLIGHVAVRCHTVHSAVRFQSPGHFIIERKYISEGICFVEWWW